MQTNLYLIRHGEAVVNVEPIVGGMRGDTGLTERGVQQATRLHDRLQASGEIQADIVIASTMPRARQTAEIVAPALGQPILFDDEVQELRVGEADGLSNQEAWSRYGLPYIESNPFHYIAPGGENLSGFLVRVGTALRRITHEHADKTIVIFCHGGVIDGSFFYFFNLPLLQTPTAGFYTHNTSITHWQDFERHGGRRWRLCGYNDVFHLRDVGVHESLDWTDSSPPDLGAHRTGVPVYTEDRDDNEQ